MDISYRPATVADIESLVHLRAAFLAEFHASAPPAPALLDAVRAYLATALPAGTFIAYLAETTGEIIGVGGLIYDHHLPTPTNPTGRQGYIMNMYTAPAWRRQGVATALLQHLLNHAQQAGCAKIFLHTAPHARAMYAKAGFKPGETEMRWEAPQ